MMRTLRSRFLIATMAAQAVAVVMLLLAGHRVMDQVLSDQLQRQGETVRELLTAAVAPQLAARDYGTVQELVVSSVESLQLAYIEVFADDDRRIARAGMPRPTDAPRRIGQITLSGEVYPLSGTLTIAGQRYGRFEVGLPATALIAAKRRTVIYTMLIAGGALLLSLLLLMPATNVLTRRLRRLAGATERIGRGEFDVQLPVQGSDEVARVTQAFNAMSAALRERVAALQESEARQRALVDALAEGVVFQDPHDRVLSCNEAAPHILGLTRNQLLGLDSMDPRWRVTRRDGSPMAADEHPSMVARRSGQPQRDALMGVLKPDGSRAWLQVNSEPLKRPGSGEVVATVTSFTDITSLIEAEDRLQQMNAQLEQRVAERTADLVAARDAAERASQAKTEFMSRMSHELRTPLNAILGFAQVLQFDGGRRVDMAASLGHIERAGWHLLDLINEVLDLSRIEAGALSVSLEPVGLTPLASECMRLSEPAAAGARVTLQLDDRAGAGLAARADRVRLRQVLMNLLSNAIKYNREGGQVVLTIAADPAEAGRVQLSVRDSGCGFTDAQREQLYEPFNRLGAETGTPGTGIGLVITKRLVELMQGTLSLDTEPGVGSTFTVTLPAAQLPRAPALPPPALADAPAGQRPGRTLLYIEDNPSNVELVRDVMTLRPGLQLLVAGTGSEGLTLAQAVQPDLVLVDIGLPDIDGNEVCRRLRAHPVLGRRPLVALSANAMPADVARGAHAGFDLYLTKPLDVPGFLRQIDRLLEQAR